MDEVPKVGTHEYFKYIYLRLSWEADEKKARALIESLGFDEAKTQEMLQDWRDLRKKEGWQVT